MKSMKGQEHRFEYVLLAPWDNKLKIPAKIPKASFQSSRDEAHASTLARTDL